VNYIALNKDSLIDIDTIKFSQNLYENLDSWLGWSVRDYNLIKKMESVGTRFGDIYDTKSGIATLRNKVYIFKPSKAKGKYFYMQDDTKIEKSICKDIVNSNKINQKNNIEDLKEKVIFPYIYNEDNKATLIKEEDFLKDFPSAYKYLQKHRQGLDSRDKGNGKYPAWYAFGRSPHINFD
jgi:hypothetical protein